MLDDRQRTTRHTAPGAAGSVAVASLAGRVSDDGRTDSDPNLAGTDGTATVTLPAEQTTAHEEGLSPESVGHACEQFEFGDIESTTGAQTTGDTGDIGHPPAVRHHCRGRYRLRRVPRRRGATTAARPTRSSWTAVRCPSPRERPSTGRMTTFRPAGPQMCTRSLNRRGRGGAGTLTAVNKGGTDSGTR